MQACSLSATGVNMFKSALKLKFVLGQRPILSLKVTSLPRKKYVVVASAAECFLDNCTNDRLKVL